MEQRQLLKSRSCKSRKRHFTANLSAKLLRPEPEAVGWWWNLKDLRVRGTGGSPACLAASSNLTFRNTWSGILLANSRLPALPTHSEGRSTLFLAGDANRSLQIKPKHPRMYKLEQRQLLKSRSCKSRKRHFTANLSAKLLRPEPPNPPIGPAAKHLKEQQKQREVVHRAGREGHRHCLRRRRRGHGRRWRRRRRAQW